MVRDRVGGRVRAAGGGRPYLQDGALATNTLQGVPLI